MTNIRDSAKVAGLLKSISTMKIVRGLGDALRPFHDEAWLVGGFVRDMLSDRAIGIPDLDIALPDSPKNSSIAVAEKFSGSPFMLDDETDSYRVALPERGCVDLIRYRANDIEGDLRKRDFTINGIAVDLFADHASGEGFFDPLNGYGDLAEGKLRLCGADVLEEDPVRILRAFRFSLGLDLEMDELLSNSIQNVAHKLSEQSPERIRTELFKTLGEPNGGALFRRLYEGGILNVIYPETAKWAKFEQGSYHSHYLLEHCFRVAESLDSLLGSLDRFDDPARLAAQLNEEVEADMTRAALLKWTGFFHDVAKPTTVSRDGTRLRFIGHDLEGAKTVSQMLAELKTGKKAQRSSAKMVGAHMRLFGLAHQERPTLRSKLRYIRDLGETTPSALLLALADEMATGDDRPAFKPLLCTAAEVLSLYWESLDERCSEPLMMGRDLLKLFDLPPSPLVGEILKAVAAAEGDGRVADREQAIELAEKILTELKEKNCK